jgi:acetaldehyde dehydrogenase/alcohol dehydrogenase
MGSYRDQCAPANPRMPMLADMKDLMVAAYYGTSIEDARRRMAVTAEDATPVKAPALV